MCRSHDLLRPCPSADQARTRSRLSCCPSSAAGTGMRSSSLQPTIDAKMLTPSASSPQPLVPPVRPRRDGGWRFRHYCRNPSIHALIKTTVSINGRRERQALINNSADRGARRVAPPCRLGRGADTCLDIRPPYRWGAKHGPAPSKVDGFCQLCQLVPMTGSLRTAKPMVR